MIGHAWRKNDKKKKSNKNEGKEAKTEESDEKAKKKWQQVSKKGGNMRMVGLTWEHNQQHRRKMREICCIEKENVTMCDRRTHTHCIVKGELEFWICISQ